MVEHMRDLDLEVLEILDNWSKEEIFDHIDTLHTALWNMKKWNELTRGQKDDLWIKAEE